ncbi:GNAT family N-acetyltransferase [Tabrizicola piscis]|uniref:GNAT family N-acetyltransferase n=1 Tax=Tabrizicola piscis TaxID=2494374 RepID=A0A3S8UB64_9RHOB|nr:GNAT family N-acetyltransferase [Tabrizicola piscis]AZL60867.1 GNAT family N-acetyltransferase [Tabrizicola piscis]
MTTIQDATPGDEAAWRALWDQYLAFYKVDLAPAISAATWARLMDPASPVKARLALVDGQVMGFAIHMHHPSTWVATEDAYLEDLFVTDAARGQGLGRALIDDLITIARAKGWARLYWHTNQGNNRARALYDQYVASDGHIRYRMAL